jgi:Fur family ferric uptake transcriptional regulator
MQLHDYYLEGCCRPVNFDREMLASIQTNPPSNKPKSSGSMAQTPINLACARLKAAGLRITQPRVSILSVLIKRGEPTSIEQIHDSMTQGACDLVTVYRCLSAFENIGLVRRSFFHNGTCLYTIAFGEKNPYYVISKDTNRVHEIDEGTTAELRRAVGEIEDILRSRGYKEVVHVVEFFALAPKSAR